MNLAVILEHRFDRTPDGFVWTRTMFAHSFWQRYLEVFDGVCVVARVRYVPEVPQDCQRADGPRVAFAMVPHYLGPRDYFAKADKVSAAIKDAIEHSDAVLLRVPGRLGSTAAAYLKRTGHPYGVEVVGDPHDVFAPGAVKHPLRPFFRRWFTRKLKQQCSAACAAAYVTEGKLQERYPPASEAFTTHYSSIELLSSAFVEVARCYKQASNPFKVVSVGTLEQMYKAPDILLKALSIALNQGLSGYVTFIGGGKHQTELEEMATHLGIRQNVTFLGQISAGKSIRGYLDQADLFVLPSRQEGLPRAMIEAMARALPCIGSTVGGIPELLPPKDMVPPGDAKALAAKILEVVHNPDRMTSMSAQNLERARGYSDVVLRERRVALYSHLREQTQAWLQSEHKGIPRRRLK